ncbi:MAG: hypothetical protein ACTSU4_06755 [Promethearchaeota archaeon]
MVSNIDKKVELMALLKNFKSPNTLLSLTDVIYFGVEFFNMRMFSDNFNSMTC